MTDEMAITRRKFLKTGGIGIVSLLSMVIPFRSIMKDKEVKGEIILAEREIKEKDWILKFNIMIPKKGLKPLISGRAIHNDDRLPDKFFSCGVDHDKWNKDEKYRIEIVRRINHNVRVAYKYTSVKQSWEETA